MLFNAIKQNLNLTFPILSTRLLSIVSNLIAMMLIAHLGNVALSAGALIMGIFSVCVLLVMAFSFCVSALVATSYGKCKKSETGEIIISSLILNTLLSLPSMLILYYITDFLILFNQPREVAIQVGQYFHGMLMGYLPMLWAGVLEQFLVGIGKPKYMVYLSLCGVAIMPLLSFILIFGHMGMPALGMRGAGYAVTGTSFFTLIFLVILIMNKKWHHEYDLFNFQIKSNYTQIKNLYKLGWPIALQFSCEFLAYVFVTFMMGWIGIVALVAQQIILQFTSVVVMIPTSVAQATAVLVGRANGQNDNRTIRRQVNAALVVVTGFMLIVGLAYVSIPVLLAHIYLDVNNPANQATLALTKVIFAITALSQCFDGVKNIIVGAYRGLQETKIPMKITTLSLWGISIPLAYILGFSFHQGAIGVRLGFAIGIILSSFFMIKFWCRNKLIVSAVENETKVLSMSSV